MNPAQNRFEIQLEKIESIINQGLQSDDVANAVYQLDLRTPFFMLEGLSRLYRRINHPKRFEKFHLQSKLIEDSLGQLDFYMALDKEMDGSTILDKKD